MPNRKRLGTAGHVLHVLNRAVRRARLFDDAGDYQAFMTTLIEAQRRHPVRLLAYCVMPNHFHFVVWPSAEGELSRFMQWLTATHSKRWHNYRGTEGTGSVYQGRFKAFPVQNDSHFLTVCRYVERNPLRAGLVERSREWPWSSVYQRCRNCNDPELHTWPIQPPVDWEARLDRPENRDGIERLRRCIHRSTPFGASDWVTRQIDLGGRS
jgi:putative transposase